VSITNLILDLVAKVCVVIVFVYLVTRTRYFTEILDKQFNVKNQIVLILIFGIFAIYSTQSGIKLPSGAIANIRDLGPIVASPLHHPLAIYCRRCRKLISRVDARGKHDKSAIERISSFIKLYLID